MKWAFAIAGLAMSSPAFAEIPYVMRGGIEQVDYDKLNPIEGFVLPDSGQFRESTWVMGEDRDHPRNPMSFSIIGDGKIVLDNNTKLMWEREHSFLSGEPVPPKGDWLPQDVFYPKGIEPRRRPFHEGVQHCKTLRLGGYDDWRSPNVKEGQSIAHYGATRPTIHEEFFPDVFSGLAGYGDRGKGGMWVGPIAPDHPNSGWHLGFIDGHLMGYPRGGYKTHRCVRADNNGTYWNPDFVDNGNGTATERVADVGQIGSGTDIRVGRSIAILRRPEVRRLRRLEGFQQQGIGQYERLFPNETVARHCVLSGHRLQIILLDENQRNARRRAKFDVGNQDSA